MLVWIDEIYVWDSLSISEDWKNKKRLMYHQQTSSYLDVMQGAVHVNPDTDTDRPSILLNFYGEINYKCGYSNKLVVNVSFIFQSEAFQLCVV